MTDFQFTGREVAMRFVGRVFTWSGIYGIMILVPMYFLESTIGLEFPPATNHPEQYYAFIGVALAWQVAFLLIGANPERYRPLMIPAACEKLLSSGASLWLFAVGRIPVITLVPFLVDLLLGGLFLLAFFVSRYPSSQPYESNTVRD